MSDDPVSPAETSVSEFCYRHPDEPTRVHCMRCDRPICPACMIEAPVGHHCPECVEQARREFRMGPRRRLRSLASTPVTTLLLYAIGAMFLVEIAQGGQAALGAGPSVARLIELGASTPLVVDPSGTEVTGGIAAGQYWRLLSAVFLHAGVWHIAINGFFLWNLGRFVEAEFGRLRTLVLFLLTGILASVASYGFAPIEPRRVAGSLEIVVGTVSVGASGAVFGFFGAYVAFNLRRRHLAAAAANLRWAFLMIAINVVFGLSVPGIDNWAHLGGLTAGIATGWLLEGFGPRRVRPLVTWVGIALLGAVGVAVTAWKTGAIRAEFPGLL